MVRTYIIARPRTYDTCHELVLTMSLYTLYCACLQPSLFARVQYSNADIHTFCKITYINVSVCVCVCVCVSCLCLCAVLGTKSDEISKTHILMSWCFYLLPHASCLLFISLRTKRWTFAHSINIDEHFVSLSIEYAYACMCIHFQILTVSNGDLTRANEVSIWEIHIVRDTHFHILTVSGGPALFDCA